MSQLGLGEVLRFLQKACALQGTCDLTDHALMERFLSQRDEGAFTFLVRRHGPMILGVGRRLLGDAHDAEDVLQAAFLVLVRRKKSIGGKKSVGGWLHGVARNIALKESAKRASRRYREREAATMRSEPYVDSLTLGELRAALDEEIARLPEKQRGPIVLCYLEGKSHDNAARELGVPKSSLESRLTKALTMLRRKLERRGITLAAATLATALTEMAAAAPLPATLTISTVKAATLVAGGNAVAGGCLSAHVLALMNEALRGMVWVKAKMILMVMGLGLAVGGAGWAEYGSVGGTGQQGAGGIAQGPIKKKLAEASAKKKVIATKDQYGDSLPVGAIARLGTLRLRHADWVYAVAMSPDGKTLASGGWDDKIRLWNPTSGEQLQCWNVDYIRAHGIMGLCFAPDGKTLVSGGNDGMIRIWDLTSNKEKHSFKGHEGSSVNCVAISPDGKVLASGGGGGDTKTLVLWDLATGNELFRHAGKTDAVRSVAFSPDGKTLASGSSHGVVQIWNMATGKELRTLEGHTNSVSGLCYAPDGKRLASASNDGTIQLWDAATYEHLKKIEFPPDPLLPPGPPRAFGNLGHGGVYSIAYSPNGKNIASAGHDGIVRLLAASDGTELLALKGHWREVRVVAYSSDGKTLVSGGMDNTIRLWDPATGNDLHPFHSHSGPVNSITVSADGKTAASGGSDAIVHLWDLITGKELRVLRGHKNTIRSVSFSPDAKTLASAASDGTVRVWNSITGEEIHRLQHSGPARAVAFSPDGTILATSSADRPGKNSLVWLWDSRTGKELHKFNVDDRPESLRFSSGGKTLAVSSHVSSIQILEMPSGNVLRRVGPAPGTAATAAFFPDGNRAVAWGNDNRAHVYDLATGKELYAFGSGYERYGPFELSADTWTMAHVTGRRVQLWDIASGTHSLVLEGHEGPVRCTGFCPDGRTLITGSEDATLLVWDLTGQAALQGADQTKQLPSMEIERAWTNLAADDALKAHQIIWTLISAPRQAIPLLRERLKPIRAEDNENIQRWIADLNSDNFAVRQSAAKELEKIGQPVKSALQRALKGNITLEMRRRMEQILNRLTSVPNSETVRTLRAIVVLERIGTAEARSVLETLAGGAPEARETEEARASLERMTRRASKER